MAVTKVDATEQKAVSKSVNKRITAQKAAKVDAIGTLTARVAVLEARQKVIIDAFQFTADECRPIYGLGGIAIIFDAVAKKLR